MARAKRLAPTKGDSSPASSARAVREPLRIFERAKLLRRIDEDVAVGADPEAPTRREIIDRRKDAVAEIGLGDRTQPGDRAARSEPRHFMFGKVRRMNQAPAFVNPGVVQQP